MPAALRDDVLERLANGVRQLTTGEAWTAHLRFMAQLHNYSFSNTILIARARPTATHVAGFGTWRKLGRSVNRGERGIPIIAPILRRRTVAKDDGDDVVITSSPSAWRVVHVFDVEQTSGEAVPEIPCHRLVGEAPEGVYDRLVGFAHAIGYTVQLSPMEDSYANGDTAFALHRIRIRDNLAPIQILKTGFHELGHALLHEDGATERALAELEAESVAFMVMSTLGIDAGDYSFGYVASWGKGDADAIEAAIRASGTRITGAARRIVDVLNSDPPTNGGAMSTTTVSVPSHGWWCAGCGVFREVNDEDRCEDCAVTVEVRGVAVNGRAAS